MTEVGLLVVTFPVPIVVADADVFPFAPWMLATGHTSAQLLRLLFALECVVV